MIILDKEIVIQMHKMLIETFGGLYGVRDSNILESSIESCFQTFDIIELYPTIEEKGACLGFKLITNHAFTDGNKRTGILAMLTFLEVNDIKVNYTDNDIIKLGYSIAKGEMKYSMVLNWINRHKTKKCEKCK